MTVENQEQVTPEAREPASGNLWREEWGGIVFIVGLLFMVAGAIVAAVRLLV